jgi:hypothetical protein
LRMEIKDKDKELRLIKDELKKDNEDTSYKKQGIDSKKKKVE